MMSLLRGIALTGLLQFGYAVPMNNLASVHGSVTLNVATDVSGVLADAYLTEALSTQLEVPVENVLLSRATTPTTRRLQSGGTVLSISYVIVCGSDCDAIGAQMATFANDPAAGAAHAAGIIAAVNAAAAASGFGNVVLSSPADVAATIAPPDTVNNAPLHRNLALFDPARINL